VGGEQRSAGNAEILFAALAAAAERAVRAAGLLSTSSPQQEGAAKPLDYLQPEHESVPRRFERDRPRLWRRVLTARDYTGSSLSPYTIAPARS
jgi:hypothetical protein